MQSLLTRLIAVFLIVAVASAASGQVTPPLSKREASIQHKVSRLAPRDRITVIRTDGEEEFGDFISCDASGFSFHDVDRKVDVRLRYDAVRSVRMGYGGYNAVKGRHTDRRKGLIVTAIVVGVLGAVIGAAAAARN